MSENKKRVAVIGYGGMGGWHTRHFADSDCVELAGIWDIKESRRELAESKGIHAYSSLEELLNDKSVELVTIATPNDCHKPLAIEAMKAGKNVISEKPVTLNSADLEEMIAASKKYGKLFTTHQNRRWDADYVIMRDLYRKGELGQVFTVESRVQGSRGIPGDWRGQEVHGGGMILDWGIHLIDQICMILGFDGIASVRCTFDHITNEEVDDGFQFWLEYENGQKAYVEVGTYNFIAMPRFYMRAKNGSALISDWRQNAHVVKCKAWHESDVVPVQTAAGLTKTMAPRDSVTVDEYDIERPVSDVHDYYRNFVRAIDGLEPQFVTHDQMRTDLRLIMKAFESVEKGGEKVLW